MTWRLVVVLSTTFFFCSSPAVGQRAHSIEERGLSPIDSAQIHESRAHAPLSRSRLSLWAAGSVRTGSILGTISEGWIGLVGFRYHRLLVPSQRSALATHDAATLIYTADLVPLASVRIPKGTPPETHAKSIRSVAEHGLSTRGIGLYPLGLRVGFSPSRVLRPFIAGHTGLFYLFDELPDERGRHTNFAVGVGVGMELSITRRTTLTLGYRYHHLSNGFRGRINPGLDANLLYIGIGTAL